MINERQYWELQEIGNDRRLEIMDNVEKQSMDFRQLEMMDNSNFQPMVNDR